GGRLAGLFYNPAGLAFRSEAAVNAAFTSWFAETSLGHLAGCLPLGRAGVLSLGATYMHLGGFERRLEDSDEPLGTFDASGLAVEAGYGLELADGLVAGLTAGLVHQRLDTHTATGVGFDAGIQYRFPFDWLTVGLAARNLGPPLSFVSEETPLPANLVGGVNMSLLGGELQLNLDAEYHLDDALDRFYAHAGAEYTVFDTVALRVGYTHGYGSQGGSLAGLSAGVGLQVVGLTFDFAYTNQGELGGTYRVGLGYDFAYLTTRRQTIQAFLDQLAEQERATSRAFYSEGQEAMSRERYAEAASAFDKALIWDPSFVEAALAYDKAVGLAREKEIADRLSVGELYLKVEDYVSALAEFSAALELEPEHPEALRLATFAADALTRQLAEREARVAELSQRAADLYAAGDYRASCDAWSEVLLLDPTNGQALGYLKLALGRLEEQVKQEKRLARSLEDQGRYDEALAHWLKARELAPEDPELPGAVSRCRGYIARQVESLVESGITRYDRGEFAAAKELLHQALRLEPGNRKADEYLAKIEAAHGGTRRETDPVAANEFYMKGVQAYTRKDYELAIHYWEECLFYQPDHPKAGANIERARQLLAALRD
ncbi:MAG TPA: PorV/PorQ family protein, partial [Candidatus Coatesbacteria bacterium]|nr:PorV/PorQ family protein [Candidatus Coatesbacteria bacterium]